MKDFTNLEFYNNYKSHSLDVVLHGGSQGIESSLIKKIVEHSKYSGNCVVAFNFPYFQKGERNPSNNLIEEQLALKQVLSFLKSGDYESIRIIGKSLGAIVGSWYLKMLDPVEQKRYSIVVLGYVKEDIDLKSFRGNITIIQGSLDKFGDIENVKQDMKDAISESISYIEIPGADHSYRNPHTQEYEFEDKAVSLIS